MIKFNIRMIGAATLLAVVIGATGCRTSSDRSTGQAINDKMINFNVDRALGNDPVYKYPDVKVHVYNGNAQLTGFVDTDEQRRKAAEIAAGVQGVTQVINEITLKPAPTGRAAIRDVPGSANPPPPPR